MIREGVDLIKFNNSNNSFCYSRIAGGSKWFCRKKVGYGGTSNVHSNEGLSASNYGNRLVAETAVVRQKPVGSASI